MRKLIDENFKKVILFFFELSPFAGFDLENLYSWYLENYNS